MQGVWPFLNTTCRFIPNLVVDRLDIKRILFWNMEHADFVLKGPKMRSTQLKYRSGVEGVWTLTGAQEYCN